jgi:Cu2+-exporting ATPase
VKEVACDHCGLPVPAGLYEETRSEQFCCAACQVVYETLHARGLDRYYDLVEQDADPSLRRGQATGRKFSEYDHESFQEEQVRLENGIANIEFYLEGVHCAACVWLVEKLPQVLAGVKEARLDLGRRRVWLRWDPQQVSLSEIAIALDRLGYPPYPLRGREEREQRKQESRRALIRIAFAGAIAGNVMAIAFALYGGYLEGMEQGFLSMFRWTSLALTALALLGPGRVFFRGAIAALRTRTPHMDLPIAIGLLAGFFGGAWNTWRVGGEVYFESIAILVFLLLVGRFLQQRQQQRAFESLEMLHAVTPSLARRITADGSVEEVPLTALAVGEELEIRQAETIPADGSLISAEARLDLAVLSGESRSVRIREGDKLFAGAVNLGGTIRCKVEALGKASRVGRLMALVEEHARRPAEIIRIADHMAGYFTVIVLLLAAAGAAFWTWHGGADPVEVAVSLLIIACPCALGLATPLAVVAAVGQAAREGFLIQGGDALERLAHPGRLLLDKTGTLTEARLERLSWQGSAALARAVAVVEEESTHPIAQALREAESEALAQHPRAQVQAVELVAGKGLRAQVDGREFLVGSPAFLAAEGHDVPEQDIAQVLARGASPIAAYWQGEGLGMAAMGDPMQAGARESLDALRAQGWQLEILSGDHPEVVQAVGTALGLPADACQGGMSPEAKLTHVEQAVAVAPRKPLEPVVMVGDGWNDAAALAAADVGIAVHGSAEASLAAADIFVARPGIARLVHLTEGARNTLRIIRRNLIVSLSYNALGVGLALTGLLNPLIAAVIMPVSSLTVVSLAWRGRSFRRNSSS